MPILENRFQSFAAANPNTGHRMVVKHRRLKHGRVPLATARVILSEAPDILWPTSQENRPVTLRVMLSPFLPNVALQPRRSRSLELP